MTRRQLAQYRLDQWDLTKRWLAYTARSLGNIIGAMEPRDEAEVVNEVFHAEGFLDAIAEQLMAPTPLAGLLKGASK